MREDFRGKTYPDRYQVAVDEAATLTVYVPRPGARLQIAPRSGIVGEPTGGGILVHYEGWVNGAMQYEHLDTRGKWEAGVQHAAGRAFVDYPTVARRMVDPDDLVEVGSIAAGEKVVRVTDAEAVSAWLARDAAT